MLKRWIGSFKKNIYFFYDQETGESTVLELKGTIKSGIMQIEKDGQIIDIQIKNVYKSDYETRINYVQLNRAANVEKV
ncbi:MAG: hypothetical protein ABS949_01900 [Solibacillus sp.]